METAPQTFALRDLSREEAELILTALLLLAERTPVPTHARILRRMGMRIDRQLPKD